MTRAEFIKMTIKQLWGADILEDNFSAWGCNDIDCPKDKQEILENNPYYDICEDCPYKDFWEKEV